MKIKIMQQKWFLLGLITLFLWSCNSNENKRNQKTADDSTKEEMIPNIEIKGVLNNVQAGDYLTLEINTEKGGNPIAEIVPKADGSFQFNGAIKEMGLFFLRLNNRNNQKKSQEIVPLTLVPDDKIELELNATDFNLSPKYSGSKWATTLNDFMVILKQSIISRDSLNLTLDSPEFQGEEGQDKMMKLIMETRKPLDKFIQEKIQEDPSDPAHIILVLNLLPSFGFDYYNPDNFESLQLVRTAFRKDYPQNTMATAITDQIDAILQSYDDYQSLYVKNEAPEIALPNPDGKEMKLSDLRGNYVLIDFWASWCTPCRRENPNLVRIYDLYKNEKFQVFSVSLDDDKENWKKAIEVDKLNWDYHVSDLLKWNTPLVQRYQFNSIPHTVLVDPNGKIVARDLRGITLEKKLQEIFKK